MKNKGKKLTLNKETVRRLTDEELKGVAGGNPTHGNTCATCGTCTITQDTCDCTCRGDTSPCCLSCPGTICP